MTQGQNGRAQSHALTRPPEGVTAGESIPRENELDDRHEQLVDQLVSQMKASGEPYTSMKESTLRDMAWERVKEVMD
jgi:hypothetical protein